ncbi:MAG: alpha/beta hydrolase family protein [Mycetocola sp.]
MLWEAITAIIAAAVMIVVVIAPGQSGQSEQPGQPVQQGRQRQSPWPGKVAQSGQSGQSDQPGSQTGRRPARLSLRTRLISAVLLGGALVVTVIVAGFRAPAVPLYLAALAVLVCAWAARARRGGRTAARWWRRGVAVVATVGVAGLVITPALILPVFSLPAFSPTTFESTTTATATATTESPATTAPATTTSIGEITAEWEDPDRADPYLTDGTPRRVVVSLWYPSEQDGPTQPYPGADVAAALASATGAPEWLFGYLSNASTPIVSNAAPAPASGADSADGRPVVLFSPGYGSTRFQNMSTVQALVAEGYVVVGVDHPFTAARLTLTDGSTVSATPEPPVTAGPDAGEDSIITVRADDIRLVLDRLDELNAPDSGSPLSTLLDLDRVAAVGHSYGGATVAEAAARDARITTVVAMDGTMWGDQIYRTGLDQPLLYLQATGTLALIEDGPSADFDAEYIHNATAGLNQIFATTRGESAYVLVDRANHFTFTDLVRMSPLVAEGRGVEEASAITDDLIVRFLDRTLNGSELTLTDAVAGVDGVTVRSQPEVIFPDAGMER